MKKESKANLIFVVVLVATMIPGITLLVRKKLSGTGNVSAEMPDAVPHARAYNQPPPFPPALPVQEPLIVRDWVQRLMQEKIGIDVSMLRGPDGPVVSDGYLTQWIASQPVAAPAAGGNDFDLWLLIWRDKPPITSADPTLAPAAQPANVGKVVSLETIPVPKEVRHALQDAGYIDPPQTAALGCYRLHFADRNGAAEMKRLKLTHTTGKPLEELLTLP